ncbi:MAG: hypothetical protein Q7S48_00795 [bacterium]|nr:hypothetical protein [bacterium]
MQFTNLLHLSYWFSVHTPSFGRVSFIIALVVLGALLAVAILLRVFSREYAPNPLLARGLRRISKPFFFMSITGLAFVGVRQVGAAVLSSRFWMVFILGGGFAWFVVIFRSLRSTYENEIAKFYAQKKYKEYLPKRRK